MFVFKDGEKAVFARRFVHFMDRAKGELANAHEMFQNIGEDDHAGSIRQLMNDDWDFVLNKVAQLISGAPEEKDVAAEKAAKK